MSDSGIRPLGVVEENFSEKFCPLTRENCRPDCMMLQRSEERNVKRCSFAIMAEQLDIMARR